jgi:hypothetical protein
MKGKEDIIGWSVVETHQETGRVGGWFGFLPEVQSTQGIPWSNTGWVTGRCCAAASPNLNGSSV